MPETKKGVRPAPAPIVVVPTCEAAGQEGAADLRRPVAGRGARARLGEARLRAVGDAGELGGEALGRLYLDAVELLVAVGAGQAQGEGAVGAGDQLGGARQEAEGEGALGGVVGQGLAAGEAVSSKGSSLSAGVVGVL